MNSGKEIDLSTYLNKYKLINLKRVYRFSDIPELYAEYAKHIKTNKWFFGLNTLDHALKGIRQPEVVLIISPPNIGKTALIMHMVDWNITFNDMMKDKILIWFTPESSELDLFERLMQKKKNLYSHELEQEFIDHAEDLIKISKNELLSYDNVKLVVGSIHIDQVQDYCMALRDESGKEIGCAMLDYAQLVEASHNNQFADMTQVAKKIHDIALDLKIPFILTSQTSRDNARNEKGLDQFSAKGSGQLENSAQIIITLQRLKEIDQNTLDPKTLERNNNEEIYILKANIEKKKRGKYLKDPLIIIQNAKTLELTEFHKTEQIGF